jgi:hypothetical protein
MGILLPSDRGAAQLVEAISDSEVMSRDVATTVGASQSSREEEGNDQQQHRQENEDAPDATETDRISADGEVKPHHQGDEQEDENPHSDALGPSRL